MSQFAPDTRPVPAILVVVMEAAQMQQDAIEAGQIHCFNGAVLRREEFVMAWHNIRLFSVLSRWDEIVVRFSCLTGSFVEVDFR